jgi:hypothetical protein
MLRYCDTPHNLDFFCTLCRTSVESLSEGTGIPTTELYEFARGERPLLARDRFAIMHFLTDRELGRTSNPNYGTEYLISLASNKQDDDNTMYETSRDALVSAATQLAREIEEEEAEEEKRFADRT